jgi:phage tail-like protein
MTDAADGRIHDREANHRAGTSSHEAPSVQRRSLLGLVAGTTATGATAGCAMDGRDGGPENEAQQTGGSDRRIEASSVVTDSLTVAGFSSVTGLEHQMEPEEYEEGGNNRYTHKLPTRYTQPNVELQRGVTDSPVLWEWLEGVREGRVWRIEKEGTEEPVRQSRKTVRIYILNALGKEKWGWEFANAYPVRWAGPEFQADQGAVAIETLEVAHEGITAMPREEREGTPRS